MGPHNPQSPRLALGLIRGVREARRSSTRRAHRHHSGHFCPAPRTPPAPSRADTGSSHFRFGAECSRPSAAAPLPDYAALQRLRASSSLALCRAAAKPPAQGSKAQSKHRNILIVSNDDPPTHSPCGVKRRVWLRAFRADQLQIILDSGRRQRKILDTFTFWSSRCLLRSSNSCHSMHSASSDTDTPSLIIR